MNMIEIRAAVEMHEGAGAKVKRLFPVTGHMNFDPFVLWDHFDVSADAGFPEHPHRGFEAITYMFEGGMQHEDNLGNRSTVTSGGAQRFTAGSGLSHSEMPASQQNSRGIQLWINLSQGLKSIAPDYQQVDADEFPELSLANGKVRVIVGEGSPLTLKTPVRYLDVSLEKNAQFNETIEAGFRGFVYLVDGELDIMGNILSSGQACFIENMNRLEIKALQSCRFMLCAGRPHGEPIRQRGPYVD